jgi:hypothetical protein
VFKFAITLDLIEENSDIKDLSEVPKNKDFEKINTKVDKLHKKVMDVMKTQNYQIYKEDEFSQKQIEVSSMLIYMTAIQVIILIILTIWQVISFKNLFKDKLSC